MALYTISDLHLSLGTDKPMDVFKGWQDYVLRLETNWKRLVTPEDTVVVGGDISWAMRLEETVADFTFLHQLPGNKILLKGNHDYWWSTMAKMQKFVEEHGFTSLKFLYNNSYTVEGISLCGTRGWMFEDTEPQDAKVIAREAGRLLTSLQSAECDKKIVFLHYPPLYMEEKASNMIELMNSFVVKECYYGHLHGGSIARAVQGTVDGVRYKLVSADALEFCPYPVGL